LFVVAGAYPNVTLKEARTERERLQELIKNDINPSSQRKAEKSTPDGYHPNCFEMAAREWYNEHKDTWNKSHGERIIRRLEKDIFPWIGKKDIAQITAPEVLTVIRLIKDRGVLETAHRAMSNCGQVFRYGVQTGKCERDVTYDLRGALPQPIRGHMASLTEPKDVATIAIIQRLHRLIPRAMRFKTIGTLVCATQRITHSKVGRY
jgi:integrase